MLIETSCFHPGGVRSGEGSASGQHEDPGVSESAGGSVGRAEEKTREERSGPEGLRGAQL